MKKKGDYPKKQKGIFLFHQAIYLLIYQAGIPLFSRFSVFYFFRFKIRESNRYINGIKNNTIFFNNL